MNEFDEDTLRTKLPGLGTNEFIWITGTPFSIRRCQLVIEGVVGTIDPNRFSIYENNRLRCDSDMESAIKQLGELCTDYQNLKRFFLGL